MKKIGLTLAAALIISGITAQTEPADTTKITLGDAKILIVENDEAKDSTDVSWTEDNEENSESDIRHELTYWSGVDVGVNLLRTSDGSTNMTGNNAWLDLDYSRSLSWSLNIFEEKVWFVKNYVGLTVGAGFTWNSYGLNKQTRIVSNTEAMPDTTFGFKDTTLQYSYSKNKLRMSYLRIPLMLEFNTSSNPDRNFHIAAGVIGGWNMGTIQKTEYEFEGKNHEDRTKGDYNVTPFTFDLSARVGFRNVAVFGTYGLTPLFEKGKGPQVYPMTVGVAFTFSS